MVRSAARIKRSLGMAEQYEMSKLHMIAGDTTDRDRRYAG